MGLCAYTVKKEQGRQRYDWDPQTPETIGQSVVLAVLFLFVGTAAGTIFCNHMSMEMKNTLEQWFAGIFAPAELSAVDYYSLFAGVLKKRFVWILVGILICQTSLSGIICYASAVCVSFQAAVIVCALTMHSGVSGILLFFGLVFPQGIFYALAAYLVWIVVREPVRGNEQSRILSMILLTALGIAAETLINPEVSAGVFRFFS